MDKLLEALKRTSLTESQVSDITKAVEHMVEEAAKQIETKKQADYDALVEEAYEKVQSELDVVKGKAEEGYAQAYEIIQDLKLRLESQEREYENKMEEGYQQAYEMLQAEQAKNETIEESVRKETNVKLDEMRDLMIEKLDLFLQMQKSEIYDEARRDVLNDPRMVEHRVTVEKIAEIMSDYLTFEEMTGNPSKKLAEAQNAIEDLKGRIQIIEKRNFNLQKQNHDLSESVQHSKKLLTEAQSVVKKNERTDRKNSGIVSGRGQKVLTETKEQLIPEFNHSTPQGVEIMEEQVVEDMLTLAGLRTPE